MAELKQHADGSLGIFSEQEGTSLLQIGGPANPAAGGGQWNYRGTTTVKIPLLNATGNLTANMCFWTNPFNENLLIKNVELRINPGGAVTGNISVGTCALSAGVPTTSANLIDTYNYPGGDATAVINNIDDKGTNGKSRQELDVGQAIVVTANHQFLTMQATLYVDFTKV